MSFLWHGLTAEGAQVPVQVDGEGRVIAVDGTPGTNFWKRDSTTLSPVNTGDSVDIGNGNITLNVDGTADISGETIIAPDTNSALFVGQKNAFDPRPTADTQNGTRLFAGSVSVSRSTAGIVWQGRTATNVGAASNNYTSVIYGDGTAYFGGNIAPGQAGHAPNITLDAGGSATFAGNITAPNVTFRSSDPRFYVKKSKVKDALPEYVGPELDLLAEIARLEALVRHLYETLRITPPAGWPVWDGNDDVLRQLRK